MSAAPQPQSRLLSVTPEVRLIIWKLALPHNEHLILDPDRLEDPYLIQKVDYGATASLLRVSEQVYGEIMPLLYSRNTVTLVEPYFAFEVLPNVNPDVRKSIFSMELRVFESLAELAFCWIELTDDYPNLKNLKLTFYHSETWLREAARLFYRAWLVEDVIIKLELHKSVWAEVHCPQTTDESISDELEEANDFEKLYNLIIPEQIQTITIAASVGKEAASALAKVGDGVCDWRFKKHGDRDTDKCNYMVWECKKEGDEDDSNKTDDENGTNDLNDMDDAADPNAWGPSDEPNSSDNTDDTDEPNSSEYMEDPDASTHTDSSIDAVESEESD